jgi:hypothetical protein
MEAIKRRQKAPRLNTFSVLVIGAIASLLGCDLGKSPPQTSELPTGVSEAMFEASVSKDWGDDDQTREWRAARADHRVIAYAILACKERLHGVDNMPPEIFSGLLLDLTPKGGHVLAVKTAPPHAPSGGEDAKGNARGSGQVSDDTIDLTANVWNVLALSDAVARARLLAVGERSSALQPAWWLWLSTLLVSGFATLFVTLQAKMRRPSDEPPAAAATPEEGKITRPSAGPAGTAGATAPPAEASNAGTTKETPPEGAALGQSSTPDEKQQGDQREGTLGGDTVARPRSPELRRWKWGIMRFEFVAFMAIALSITGTSLNALKQYFDPTRAVVQNERALLGLRQLHQDVAQGISCELKKDENGKVVANITVPDAKKTEWQTNMHRWLGEIASPYSPTTTSERQTPPG